VPILSIGGGAENSLADTNGDGTNDAFRTNQCCSDAFGKWDLAAGNYTLEAISNEQGGGAGFFVFGAAGDYNRSVQLSSWWARTSATQSGLRQDCSSFLNQRGSPCLPWVQRDC
jgi:hypothetical protein